MCRSRRELSNAYFLAKFGFDTEENEPCKVCPLSGYSYYYRSPRFNEDMTLPPIRVGYLLNAFLACMRSVLGLVPPPVAAIRRWLQELPPPENLWTVEELKERIMEDPAAALRTRMNNIE